MLKAGENALCKRASDLIWKWTWSAHNLIKYATYGQVHPVILHKYSVGSFKDKFRKYSQLDLFYFDNQLSCVRDTLWCT